MRRILLLVTVALVMVALLASPAWAADYTVNNVADTTDSDGCTTASGGCTLREAINAANSSSSDDTIDFDLGTEATIELDHFPRLELPKITDPAGLTIDGGSADITVSGADLVRVFFVDNGAELTVSNLTVANGTQTVPTGLGAGGIFNIGDLTVNNSTFSENHAGGGGGGISNLDGTVTVNNSTFSGNSVIQGGGGINNDGGTLTVTNSTFSGNSTQVGIGFGGGAGGIFNFRGTATLKNTIVANSPSGGDCSSNPNAIFTDGGYNLIEDGSCITEATSRSGDPDLGPLANNGGPTKTQALLTGSPAIDQGKSFGENTDQRGEQRPSNFPNIPNASGGDGSDIGAFEVQAPQVQPPAADTKSPRVSSTIPSAGAKSVGPSANIKATFSEEMLASSINRDTFKLFKKGSTTKVGATVSYNPNKDMAILNPNNSLQRGVTYKAVVTTGARDEAGNRLDQNRSVSGLQPKVWVFKVRN